MTSSERGNTATFAAARWLIRCVGGRAVRVRPSRLLDSFGPISGLAILGGVDVDPALYGGSRDPRRRIERARDRRELELVTSALDQGVPLLGICRGAQLLNVALGGTLRRLARRRPRSALPYRRARLASGSTLRRITRRPAAWINTMHDYAVDRLGDGLSINAVDSAGVVQGVERSDNRALVLGVQWHPELLPYTPTSRRLFRALVDDARGELRPALRGSSRRSDRARA